MAIVAGRLIVIARPACQAPFHEEPTTKFDAVLVDGRARPQAAVEALFFLKGPDSVVFIHDWNRRDKYHAVLALFDIKEQQVESNQGGGSGLVVLTPKANWRQLYREWKAPAWW